MRVAQCILFSLLFASVTAFADWQYNLTYGVTPISHDIYGLHMIVFWVCVGIGIVVFGAMIYAIIHHRKSKGAKPAQFHEHLWVELTWSIVPVIILILLAVPATQVLMHIRDTEQADLTIKITGYQWKWQYEYLGQGVRFFSNQATPFAVIHNGAAKNADYLRTVDHPLVLPVHKKIRFLLTSNDVVHSWWVPDLGVKQDAVPGYIIGSWTRIDRAGTYHGQCSELCGTNHAYMQIVVVAMGQKDFDQWLLQQKGEGPTTAAAVPANAISTAAPLANQPSASAALPAPLTLAEQMKKGEGVYNNTCAVCHQVTGDGLPPTFPALKGDKFTKGPLPLHLNRVLFGKPGTAMQAFKDQLSDDEIAAVVTYERNAWGNSSGTVVQAAEVKAAKEKGALAE